MATTNKVKTIGVLTSGGDAPGMNAAIRAAVRRGLQKGVQMKGILKGYDGLMNEEIIDMTARDVSDTIERGGTILYTARWMRTPEGQKRAADVCRKHGIDGLVVIGGDGSFAGAQKLAALGINTVGVPGTIDLDIACTEYTIGFDTAVNTAMEAIDKVRDTSTSHERCSIIEVMGRNAGYIALWCGIANGAEDILLPERYDYDEQKLIDNIINNRKKGKKHHIIVNAEGIGHSASMARRIEAATGIDFYKEQQQKIADFANKVHAGEITNAAGEKFTTVVQIGIGGSDLGPRAMYLALENWAKKNNTFKMEAKFISNVDPDDAAAVLYGIDVAHSIFVLVSKSGTTLETLTNESFVKDALKNAGLDASRHMIAVTSETSPLAKE